MMRRTAAIFSFIVQNNSYTITRISQSDATEILDVYRQCEDFLSLGPQSTATMEMVLKDLETSQNENGSFCGIFNMSGKMIGIVDYIPRNYDDNPTTADIALLMIAAPHRKTGIGKAVIETIENEIRKDPVITKIVSGVQVNNPQAIRFWKERGFRIVSEPKLRPDQTIVFDLQKDLSSE